MSKFHPQYFSFAVVIGKTLRVPAVRLVVCSYAAESRVKPAKTGVEELVEFLAGRGDPETRSRIGLALRDPNSEVNMALEGLRLGQRRLYVDADDGSSREFGQLN